MPKMNEIEMSTAWRKDAYMFFVLDTSDEMGEQAIDVLNRMMFDMIDAMKSLTDPQTQLKIAAITYNEGCSLIPLSGPVNIEHFKWRPILATKSKCDVGEALYQLEHLLDMCIDTSENYYAPICIFCSTGKASDDYEKPLSRLKSGGIFNKCVKIAFALPGADLQMLKKITDTSEAIFTTDNLDMLPRMCRFREILVIA